MHFSALRLKTPPAVEPISLAAARLQIKMDSDFEDVLINEGIAAARRDAENFLRRSLVTQTWTLAYDEFPDGSGGGRHLDAAYVDYYRDFRIIPIPRPPLQTISSIKYIGRRDALDPTRDSAYDAATRLHTLDPAHYQVDALSEPGRIAPITSEFWPFTDLNLLSPALNSVQVEFIAGYGDAATVASFLPNAIQAMKMMLAHLFENREAVITGLRAAAIEIPLGARDLLWPDRIVTFA
jgi:hypothetical protein